MPGVRVLTRNGNDWADRYPSVSTALKALDISSCVVDGEITACDEHRLRHSMCCATGTG